MVRSFNSLTNIRTTVFLIDDNVVIREGLGALLRREPDIEVVGYASVGPDTLEKAGLARPDVVVMTMDRSGALGTEIIREILRADPGVRLAVVSAKVALESLSQLLRMGVKGYVLTESADREIVRAVRALRAGKRYLSPMVSSVLIDFYVKASALSEGVKDPLLSLSMREKEILQLVAEGKASGTIAETLNLSVSTVSTYRCLVMKKLGLRDLPELVRFAIRNGITPLSPSNG